MSKIIFANRYDGLGERLRAILNALYLSQKLNLEFKFYWRILEASSDNIDGNKLSPIFVPDKKDIFNDEFIEKFFKEDRDENYFDEFGKYKGKSIEELVFNPPSYHPYICTQKRLDLIFNDIKDEYLDSTRKIWENIGFNEKLKNVLNQARQKANSIGNFTALHIRSGDAIFNKNFQKSVVSKSIHYRALAVPLALEVISIEIQNNNKIIIFSDDLDLLQSFKNNLSKVLNLTLKQENNLIYSIDLNIHSDNLAYQILYENYLMSLSSKIYCTSNSGFANLAVLIGNKKEEIYIYEYFSPKKQYEILEKYIDKLDIHRCQNVFSCYQAYRISLELHLPLSVSKKWLNKALSYDQEGDVFRLLFVYCLFLEKNINGVDSYLKNHIIHQDSFMSFCEILFHIGACMYLYDFMFNLFFKYAHHKYQYISLFASCIALNLNYNHLYQQYRSCIQDERLLHLLNAFPKNSILIGAVFRMKNHLSYKIGEIIANHYNHIFKMIKCLLKLYLSYKMRFNKEKLPHLYLYTDYFKAEKFVKNHPYYILGASFIKANKNWYKLGYIQFFKDCLKLYKKYRLSV